MRGASRNGVAAAWPNLAPNSPNVRWLAALLDQGERGGIPERGRAAVAEHNLVAVRQREEVGEAGLDPADEILHGSLAVRGAHDRGTLAREVGELLGAHLGGAAAEASVEGQEVGGDGDVGHFLILLALPGRPLQQVRLAYMTDAAWRRQ